MPFLVVFDSKLDVLVPLLHAEPRVSASFNIAVFHFEYDGLQFDRAHLEQLIQVHIRLIAHLFFLSHNIWVVEGPFLELLLRLFIVL